MTELETVEQFADAMRETMLYQEDCVVFTAGTYALIEADRAAVRRALLEEIEAEALRQYREHAGPKNWTNAQKLQVAAGAFRETLDALKAKYATTEPAQEAPQRAIVVGSTWKQDMPPGIHIKVLTVGAAGVFYRWARGNVETAAESDFRLWFTWVSDPAEPDADDAWPDGHPWQFDKGSPHWVRVKKTGHVGMVCDSDHHKGKLWFALHNSGKDEWFLPSELESVEPAAEPKEPKT